MYKISRIQICLVITLALFLQLGALDRVEIAGAKPDLLLACVVFFGLFLGAGPGLKSGLLAGFLKDIFAFDFFFVNAVTLGLTGLAAGLVGNKFFKESKKADLLLVILFTALSMSLHYAFVSFFSRAPAAGYPEFFICGALPASIYTGIVSVPLYKFFINFYNLKEADDYL